MPFAQDILTRIIRVNWGSPILVLTIKWERYSPGGDFIAEFLLESEPFELDDKPAIPPIADHYYDPPKIEDAVKDDIFAWNWPTYVLQGSRVIDNTATIVDRATYEAYDLTSGLVQHEFVDALGHIWVPFCIDYTGDVSDPPSNVDGVIDGTNPNNIEQYMNQLNSVIPGANNFVPNDPPLEVLRSHTEGEIINVNSHEGNVLAFLSISKAKSEDDGDPDLNEFKVIVKTNEYRDAAYKSFRGEIFLLMYVGRSEFAVDAENVLDDMDDKAVAGDAVMLDSTERSFASLVVTFNVNLKEQTIEADPVELVPLP